VDAAHPAHHADVPGRLDDQRPSSGPHLKHLTLKIWDEA
jgi:hypothetical protein